MSDRAREWLTAGFLILLTVIALLFAVDAKADDIDPQELAECLQDRAARTERLHGCIKQGRALEQEVTRLRAANAAGASTIREQSERLNKAEGRVKRQRVAGLVVGVVAGASVAYGSVWLARQIVQPEQRATRIAATVGRLRLRAEF